MTKTQAEQAGFRSLSLFASSEENVKRVERAWKAGRALYGLLRKTAAPSMNLFIEVMETFMDCLQEFIRFRAATEKTRRLETELNELKEEIRQTRRILEAEENAALEQWLQEAGAALAELRRNAELLFDVGRHLQEIGSLIRCGELYSMADRRAMQELQKNFFEATIQYYALLQKVI